MHYWNTTADAPQLNDRLTNMVNSVGSARALLLGRDTALVGVRASYRRPGAIASLSKRIYMTGAADQPGVNEALSLACKWNDASFTRQKVTHLRGFWDSVEKDGNYTPTVPEAADWEDRFDLWKATLITGNWGWLTRNPATSAVGIVNSYTQAVDGIITFTLAPPGVPPGLIGTPITIKFSKLNNSKSPLNTQLTVIPTNATTLVTTQQIAAGPFFTKGKWSYRDTIFTAYNNVYSVSTGRRAQGRPFDRLPGRRSARPKY